MPHVAFKDGTQIKGLNANELKLLINEIFIKETYISHGIKVQPGDCIFDVGANIGIFMRYVYAKCRGHAQVYSFEPVPKIFNILKQNADRDPDKLHVFPFGISNEEKTVNFEFPVRLSIWASAKPGKTKERLDRWWIDAGTVGLRANSRSGRFIQKWMRRLYLYYVSKKIESVTCSLKTLSQVINQENIGG